MRQNAAVRSAEFRYSGRMINLCRGDLTQASCGLAWLVRLRWFAVVGQILTCLVAAFVFRMALPLVPLAVGIGLALVSNILLMRCFFSTRAICPETVVFGVILLDTMLLTWMLFFTGGAHNPFSTFYLLQIAIAAILLADFRVWFVVVAGAAGFGLLFLSPFELACHTTGIFELTFDLHLQGMLVAQVLCGAFLAYFVSSLRRNLGEIDAELGAQRALAENRRHLTAIATLAAGVAHELATPLSTIAVANAELNSTATEGCGSKACAEDARLIHREVQRCRSILGRLNLDALRADTEAGSDSAEAVLLAALPTAILGRVPSAQKDRIRFAGFDEGRTVGCSGDLLVQSAVALIENALAAGEGPVEVRCEAGDGAVEISVTDSGIGMEPDVAARAGEPFFSLRPPGSGMGLGLFLARMFAESVDGRFSIESRPGGGTAARLVLPGAKP